MTENEAIIQLNFDMEMIRFNPSTGESLTLEQIKAHNEDNYKTYLADELAITALLEIQQYRAIGTIDEFKALKEKSEPKKVKTNKYLVGDRVVYIGNSLDFKGKMGTIIRLAEKRGKEYDEVKFDDPYYIDDDGYKYCNYFCFAENLQKIDWQ